MNVEREIADPAVLHLSPQGQPGLSLCGKPTAETNIAVTCWGRQVDPAEGAITFCQQCDALKESSRTVA